MALKASRTPAPSPALARFEAELNEFVRLREVFGATYRSIDLMLERGFSPEAINAEFAAQDARRLALAQSTWAVLPALSPADLKAARRLMRAARVPFANARYQEWMRAAIARDGLPLDWS